MPTAPEVEVDLVKEPATLSHAPTLLAGVQPLEASNEFVRVCFYPAPGYSVSARWTLLTPSGRDVRLRAWAELTNGRTVAFESPSSGDGVICVQPRLGGPLEASVARLRVVASSPVVVGRISWQSTSR